MDKEHPQIFISYSWKDEKDVLELSKKLVSEGIDVKLDKWDLKEGQDKYKFMEQCVNSNNIFKVLIICSKSYMEKSNERKGGVGDETMIISPELYGKENQEKFIPIIFERDNEGREYMPTYIKSRIYIDLCEDNKDYENEYEKLVRNIYNKPLFKKPALGQKPKWLNNDNINLRILLVKIDQIGKSDGINPNKDKHIANSFKDTFIEKVLEYKISDNEIIPKKIVSKIGEMKPIRDLFVDFIETLMSVNFDISDFISSFFEEMYNRLKISDHEYQMEYYSFFIWDNFICMTAVLLHYEKFAELYNILCRTYFLKVNFNSNNITPTNYFSFRKYFSIIEEKYKPVSEDARLYTYVGNMLVNREKRPVITGESISRADVILFHLSIIYEYNDNGDYGIWFPTTYVYDKTSYFWWQKLVSKKYCEKIFPLFGVKSMEELKYAINKCYINNIKGYEGYSLPGVLDSLELDTIGTYN